MIHSFLVEMLLINVPHDFRAFSTLVCKVEWYEQKLVNGASWKMLWGRLVQIAGVAIRTSRPSSCCDDYLLVFLYPSIPPLWAHFYIVATQVTCSCLNKLFVQSRNKLLLGVYVFRGKVCCKVNWWVAPAFVGSQRRSFALTGSWLLLLPDPVL